MTRGTDEQFHALTASVDPTCNTQAVGHPQWRNAMDQEFNALLHNNTWSLTPTKPGINVIGCKWVYRAKHKADGSIERYKARLVAKGFNQVAGEDFFETDVQSKVSDVVLGKENPVEESNPEYEKLKHYIFELEDHLAEAQKHSYGLVKRHRELGQSLSDFGKAVKLLGTSEGNSLGKAFSDLGAKCELQSIKLQKEAHNLLMNFEEPLKDYVRAVQSIKATMAERANAFKHQCEMAETIKFKEIDINKLRLMRSDKLAEAEREYEVLKVEGEEAGERFKTIARLMNEEIVQFQEQKTLDIGVALHEFAKGQAHLENSVAEAWRGLLPKLEACS
ncbi:PREDICTED: sorting nexin 1-like [Ipomoea nil]|uniref:sorting nexin 1-like n=1 Tax=Ipomoea nil TaxID=35883 RepID=UPI0009014443|nr:PREDICTED: sorting nexin 1-like [Ipomoea nil]